LRRFTVCLLGYACIGRGETDQHIPQKAQVLEGNAYFLPISAQKILNFQKTVKISGNPPETLFFKKKSDSPSSFFLVISCGYFKRVEF